MSLLSPMLLQAQLESATHAAREYEHAAHASDAQLRDASRQLQELQRHSEELAGRCEAAGRARQQAEEQGRQQLAAMEVRYRAGGTQAHQRAGTAYASVLVINFLLLASAP